MVSQCWMPYGKLDQVEPVEVIGKIVKQIRRVRPQVIITFDPYGSYGHPDHIAISQFTTAAILGAADPTYAPNGGLKHHRVSKLYYLVATPKNLASYQAAFGDLIVQVDGVERGAVGWQAWAITTRLDIRAYRQQIRQAIVSHQSQLPGYQTLAALPEAHCQNLWQIEAYYRAFSLVNGGREEESDLFEGFRELQ